MGYIFTAESFGYYGVFVCGTTGAFGEYITGDDLLFAVRGFVTKAHLQKEYLLVLHESENAVVVL